MFGKRAQHKQRDGRLLDDVARVAGYGCLFETLNGCWRSGASLRSSPGHPAIVVITLVVAAFCVAMSGCATHAERVAGLQNSFYAGDMAAANDDVARLLEKPKKDADVLKLDQAMIALLSGEPQRAEGILRQVRDRFDYLEQTSVGEQAMSMVADERRKAYAGEDYEKILIRALLSLSNLMSDGTDAGAYALQALDKQRQIEQST